VPASVRYIRALVERGDVRKRRNPADGRSYLLELTAQGRRLDVELDAAGRGRPSLEQAYAKLEPHLVRPPRDYIDRAVELRVALREALAEG